MRPSDCAVVIPAAGTGSRFGGELPKQYLPLRGRPLIVHTATRFARDESVAKVIVCVAPEQMDRATALFDGDSSHKIVVVVGGESRQESVTRGLEAIASRGDVIVAVHDAVRPFFSFDLFHALIELAAERGAAIPILPLTDTLHHLRDGEIIDTPRREEWGLAQTPQCFRLSLLRAALEHAREAKLEGTDEAGIVRHFGHAVSVISGERHNLKITHADDLRLAEQYFDQWSAI
jgi:2-C-methyl-D-erythritol 4-phosphate cytidylyltransferase